MLERDAVQWHLQRLLRSEQPRAARQAVQFVLAALGARATVGSPRFAWSKMAALAAQPEHCPEPWRNSA